MQLLEPRPGNRGLDQSEIREVLKKIDSRQWESVLQELTNVGSYFMRDKCFEKEDRRKDLISFLDNLLFACVEDDLDDHLKPTIDWLGKLTERHSYLDTLLFTFYQNNVAMARACKKKDVGTVFTLYKAGFRLKTKLERHDVLKLDEDQLMMEISLLEVRASHAYLLAETHHREANSLLDNWVIGNDPSVGDTVSQDPGWIL